MFQVVFLKQVVDDSIREGDVVVETNGNEHPRLSFIIKVHEKWCYFNRD